MREGNFNRVERAERVEKGLGVSSQELESGEVIAHAKSAKFAKSDVGNVLTQRHKGTESWPMVRLGDVCETISTRGHQIKQAEIKQVGRYPVVTQSENEIEGFTDDNICINDVPIVLFGDHTCVVKAVGEPFVVGADGTKLLKPRGVDFEYLVFIVKKVASGLVDGKYRRHYSDLVESLIPLPPIEVQKEIVERLEKELGETDKVASEFKRIVELADKEFKAELDETFGGLGNGELGTGKGLGVSSQELGLAAKNAKCAKDWLIVRLGDVCEVARGGSPRPIKQYITDDSNGLNWIKIGDVDSGGKYIEKTSEKIKLSGLCKTRKVNAGEFLLSNSMSFGRPYILKIDGCIHDGWLVLRGFESVLEENFFYYLLRSRFVQEQFELYAHGSTVRNLNTKSVEEVQIPLPPIEVQKEIVAKLDAAKERCEKLKAEAERGLRAAENLRKAILSEAFE